MRYKRSTESVGEIAGELGVSTVLEGSVHEVGDRVRVTAQLIDAASDRHLWADSFDRVLTDVFAIQSEVAERIAEALGATLTAAQRRRIARRPTDDIEAYNLYLLGRHAWDRLTEEAVEKSVSFFEQAIPRDPQYALAHYRDFFCRTRRWVRIARASTIARSSGPIAIALDPNLPVGHALSALVHVQRGDMAKAREASMRAREFIGTQYPATNALYACVCAASGDSAQAVDLLRELDARRATENIWLFVVAMSYARLGDIDTAFARLQEAVDERGGWIAWLAVEPALDPLRADARFEPLVRSVGLVPPR